MGNHYDLGINVKYYGNAWSYPCVSDERAEVIWQEWCDYFWMMAKEYAEPYGYEVYSEGRMGGWLVVYEGNEMVKPHPDFEYEIKMLFNWVAEQMEAQFKEENADESHLIRGEH